MVIGCTWLQAVPHVIVWPVHRDKSNAHKLSFITGLHYLFWHKKSRDSWNKPLGEKKSISTGSLRYSPHPNYILQLHKTFPFWKAARVLCSAAPNDNNFASGCHLISQIQRAYSGARKVAHGAHSLESSLFYHYRTTHKDLYYCTWINRALHFTHWGHCTWLARGAFFSSFPTAPAEQQEPRHPCHDQMSHSACSWYLSWKASCRPPVVFCAAIFF